jgi:uncharacterized protein
MAELLPFLVITVAAFLAGGINALAGGGSFLTLPALVFAGVPAVSANATGTAALLPGYLASAWSYRDLMRAPVGLSLLAVVIIGTIGGAGGALLLLATSEQAFRGIVPWLLLFATLLFAFGPALQRRLPARQRHRRNRRPRGHPRGLRLRRLFQRRHGHRDAGDVPPARRGGPAHRQRPEKPALGGAHADRGAGLRGRRDHLLGRDPADGGRGDAGGLAGARIGRVLPPVVLRNTIVLVGAVTTILFFLDR